MKDEEVKEVEWQDFVLNYEKGRPLPMDELGDPEEFANYMAELQRKLKEAEEEAILNGIQANTIVLNEKYDYVKKFYFSIDRGFDKIAYESHPMLLGKEVILAPLPEGIHYALFERPVSRNPQEDLNLLKKYIKIIGHGENLQFVFKGISSKKHKEDFEEIRKILGVYDDEQN